MVPGPFAAIVPPAQLAGEMQVSVPEYANTDGIAPRAKSAAMDPSKTAVFSRMPLIRLKMHIRLQKPKSLGMNLRFIPVET